VTDVEEVVEAPPEPVETGLEGFYDDDVFDTSPARTPGSAFTEVRVRRPGERAPGITGDTPATVAAAETPAEQTAPVDFRPEALFTTPATADIIQRPGILMYIPQMTESARREVDEMNEFYGDL